jgi:hypothetical protein
VRTGTSQIHVARVSLTRVLKDVREGLMCFSVEASAR